MNVLKSPSSISLYGDAGKNGVILITTKKGLGNVYVQNKMQEVKEIHIDNSSNAKNKKLKFF